MNPRSAIVAGHICLDILPQFAPAAPGSPIPATSYDFQKQFQPGSLTRVGPAIFSTGGAVANTGLALHRLGTPTTLIARTGDDAFGETLRGTIAACGPDLDRGITIARGETTSYSIIISPPGVDRLFLHCSGANDAFSAADVPAGQLQQAALLHFGYPPVMRRMYLDSGAELEQLFREAKQAGVTTSLDLCWVDPASEAGRLDWSAILGWVLPSVDVFTPSIDEILFMLDRREYERAARFGMREWLLNDPGRLSRIGQQLLDMGAKIVLLKLGDCGAYLRTASEKRLAGLGRAQPADMAAWGKRELWAPCFSVDVAGTTGSGDATIAGFLAALLRDQSPEAALASAVAVGACNVEAPDALSGIPDWDAVQARIKPEWKQLIWRKELPGWEWAVEPRLWAKSG